LKEAGRNAPPFFSVEFRSKTQNNGFSVRYYAAKRGEKEGYMRQTGRKLFKTTAVVSAMLPAAAAIFAPTVFSHNNSAPNFDCIGCHEGEMVTDMVEIRGLPKTYVPGKKYDRLSNLTAIRYLTTPSLP